MTFANAVTSLAEPSTWLEALRSIGAYDTYHTPEYQRLAAPGSYETVLLSYEADGVRVVLPLTLRPLPESVRIVTGYSHDATSVYGYPGPLRTSRGVREATDLDVEDAWRESYVAWLAETCRELSVLTAFVRNHPLLDARDLLSAAPFQLGSPSPTVAIDLTRPQDVRLQQATAHHRRALRKSLAHGLTFGPEHGDAAIAEFTSCYRETMAKHGANDSYLLTEDRVAELLDGLGGRAELWLARKPDGSVPTAGIFLRTNGIVQYHLGGTRTSDYGLAAARPLFEAVAEAGHERGDRWFHLGGGVGGDDDSLLRYKGGFGPERFSFRTARAVFDLDAYAEAVRASGLDPDRGFFPAYRDSALGV